MAFATRTWKDTTHTATVICDFTNESSGGTAVDASGLAGHNNGAKLSISHIWYGISHAADDGATILLFAPSDPETTVPIDISRHFFKRDITVTTTYAGSPEDHREALQLIAEKRVTVKEMITQRIGLKEIQSGFDLVKSGIDSQKVIREPNRIGQQWITILSWSCFR